jgi:hypothetical protein
MRVMGQNMSDQQDERGESQRNHSAKRGGNFKN